MLLPPNIYAFTQQYLCFHLLISKLLLRISTAFSLFSLPFYSACFCNTLTFSVLQKQRESHISDRECVS